MSLRRIACAAMELISRVVSKFRSVIAVLEFRVHSP
jgi:hypothetical protein